MRAFLAPRLCLLAALSIGPAFAAAPKPVHLSASELQSQVYQVAAQVKNAEDNLRIVETQYADRQEPSADEIAARRFSDGEIQYLLGDWRTSSVLFYDLVSDKAFEGSDHRQDALYYLADSLFQQGNLIGSRLYLRQLLALNGRHYKEGLARYLEIAGKLNDFEGIDGYITRARELSGGELPQDIAYVYGKWLFRRSDLSLNDRLDRASEVFAKLSKDPQTTYRLQSKYFLGVVEIQRGHPTEAVARFMEVAQDAATPTERDLRVKELANLSLGRMLYELGKYDEAIDRYQEIPRESEYFPDSLYEIAWTKVKKSDFEGAKNAVELLELVAPDSILKPDADILYAHLFLKLHRYDEASETYHGVLTTFAPVRDQMDTLLTVNTDPIAYFDNLLARNDKTLDVNALLPPIAVKWATTQREVTDAARMVSDIEGGQHGLNESKDIAQSILRALSDRGLQAFPALQEGFTRADAVQSGLAQSEVTLTQVEAALVEDLMTPEELHAMQTLRAGAASLQERFRTMPKSEKELAARKDRMQSRVDQLDKQAFQLGYDAQSMSAMLTAIEKWVDDTRAERQNTAEDEKAFGERVRLEKQSVDAIEHDLNELRATLKQERAQATSSLGGEDSIRARLLDMLRQQHELIAKVEARLPPDGQAVVQHANEVRQKLAGLNDRVEAAKGKIQGQVAFHRDEIRQKVTQEQALLTNYGQETTVVSTDARHLVGRIAFDSFRRVRQQFYELVLKADVGLVDVSFSRKQDKTAEIQKLSQQKDHELRALDEEFKEVLKDVD